MHCEALSKRIDLLSLLVVSLLRQTDLLPSLIVSLFGLSLSIFAHVYKRSMIMVFSTIKKLHVRPF